MIFNIFFKPLHWIIKNYDLKYIFSHEAQQRAQQWSHFIIQFLHLMQKSCAEFPSRCKCADDDLSVFFCTFIQSWAAVNSREFGISLGLGQKRRIWSHVNEHLIKVVKTHTENLFFLRISIYFSFIHLFSLPLTERICDCKYFSIFTLKFHNFFLFLISLNNAPIAGGTSTHDSLWTGVCIGDIQNMTRK